MNAWMFILVSLVGGGILIGLGLAKARPVNPASGWLFVAAGAILPLSSCCTQMVFLTAEGTEEMMLISQIATAMGSGADLVATILIAAAFAVLARAKTAASPRG